VGENGALLTSASLVIRLFLLLAALSAPTGCTSGSPQIAIAGQEAKLSPVILGVCSIFMRIENSGNGSDNLLSAKVDIPGTITELHDVKDGKMVKREKIPIPAEGVVELRPGSLHIMVFRLPNVMKEDEEVILDLVFEKSGKKRLPVKLKK
jgi:copper(I)-binding protein